MPKKLKQLTLSIGEAEGKELVSLLNNARLGVLGPVGGEVGEGAVTPSVGLKL